MIYCSGEPRSPIEPIVKSVRHNTNYWFISVSLNIVKVVYMFVLFLQTKRLANTVRRYRLHTTFVTSKHMYLNK